MAICYTIDVVLVWSQEETLVGVRKVGIREGCVGDSLTEGFVWVEPTGWLNEEAIEVFHHVIVFVDWLTGFGVVAVAGDFVERAATLWSEKYPTLLQGTLGYNYTSVEVFGGASREEVMLEEVGGDRRRFRSGIIYPRCGFNLERPDEAAGECDVSVNSLTESIRITSFVKFMTDDRDFRRADRSEHDCVRFDWVGVDSDVEDRGSTGK
jgi:hypothetical protein